LNEVTEKHLPPRTFGEGHGRIQKYEDLVRLVTLGKIRIAEPLRVEPFSTLRGVYSIKKILMTKVQHIFL